MQEQSPNQVQKSGQAMSRRTFAALAGAAAAAPFAAGAPFARTADRTGTRNPVVGKGEHTYECIHDWITPPKGLSFGDTHGLTQDKAGRIYLAQTVHASSEGADAVCVFDPDGKFIESWGSEFRGGAHGLDIREESGEEFLYHCDTRRRLIVKTNLKGEVLFERSFPSEAGVYADAGRWCPTNVAFSPDGDFLVGDGYGSSYIHRYSADGSYKSTIARPGSKTGEVSCPHGLWLDDRFDEPRLAVADRSNRRIQYMTFEGEHLGFVRAGIRQPCHFKTRNGFLLVPDLASVVTILGPENQVITHLGDGQPSNLRGAPREKFIDGKFVHPHDAIWLANGDILVAEWVPIGRVTLLRKT